MAEMGKSTLKEMDRVILAVAESETQQLPRTSSNEHIDNSDSSQTVTQSVTPENPLALKTIRLNASETLARPMQDLEPCLFDPVSDLDLFGMFDPAFDLEGVDAYIEKRALTYRPSNTISGYFQRSQLLLMSLVKHKGAFQTCLPSLRYTSNLKMNLAVMPHRRTSRAQRRLQHEYQMPANDIAPSRGGHGRWTPHSQQGRGHNRPPRRNSMPQINHLNRNSVSRGTHSSWSRYPYRQSHSFLPNRRNSTTSIPHNHRPYTAPSRPNDGSRAFFRDIHNPKYHSKIQALISEGSLLSQKLQDFLKDIEFVLKSDPEEMDWDHTSQKELVSDGIPREEWEDIRPEVKNPFDRLTVQRTLTIHERRDESHEPDAGTGVEESGSPEERVVS
ncbi:hypothetical protein MMC17_005923 [Xylographa soralifera]|nr:hypothetical protein [Xylographa soralifera]